HRALVTGVGATLGARGFSWAGADPHWPSLCSRNRRVFSIPRSASSEAALNPVRQATTGGGSRPALKGGHASSSADSGSPFRRQHYGIDAGRFKEFSAS